MTLFSNRLAQRFVDCARNIAWLPAFIVISATKMILY